MPQPLRKTCPISFSGLVNRPEHAMAIGNIVGVSGRLENALGWLMAFLSQGSAAITIAMFNAVSSTEAQRAMLAAAAEHRLRGAERDAFDDLMEDFRPRYRERNRIIHNVWGHSDAHPDKALWWKSSDLSTSAAALAASATVEDVHKTEQDDLSLKAMAYTVKDLQDIAARLAEFTGRVQNFVYLLSMAHPAIAAVTNAATNAPPIGDQSQLELPDNPASQTDP
jgi:hypothetical protein